MQWSDISVIHLSLPLHSLDHVCYWCKAGADKLKSAVQPWGVDLLGCLTRRYMGPTGVPGPRGHQQALIDLSRLTRGLERAITLTTVFNCINPYCIHHTPCAWPWLDVHLSPASPPSAWPSPTPLAEAAVAMRYHAVGQGLAAGMWLQPLMAAGFLPVPISHLMGEKYNENWLWSNHFHL